MPTATLSSLATSRRQSTHTCSMTKRHAQQYIYSYIFVNWKTVQDGVSACTIAKVAGTTWHEHFLALGRC